MNKKARTLLALFSVFLAAGLVAGCGSGTDTEPANNADTPNEPAPTTATVGKPAPEFTLTDAHGTEHSLGDYRGKFVVLEWVNFGCPFVQGHYNAGNMQQLQQTYTAKGVVWLSICSSAPGKQGYYEGQALRDRIDRIGSNATAYLVDPDGAVGTTYQARTTPHMYVIDLDGILIYAGAIDDGPNRGTEEILAATNYVRLALEAAMAGREVETKQTKPYGCSVKY
jgi:glutathione peroxidase-family protein